jgi:hypothetical protein
VPEDSSLAGTAKPLVWLGDQGPAGVWGAFLALVVLAVGTWLVGVFLRRSRSLHLRPRRAGLAWGVPLDLTLVSEENEPDAD